MKIILADIQEQIVDHWQRMFRKVAIVSVRFGSIFDVECDAIISPANSFGFMDGGLDLHLSHFFGWHVQKHLQELIKTRHHGELLVGRADIVPTGHDQIPYLIAAPTMRVPMILNSNSINVYLATRAVLLLIKHGRLQDGTPVKDVVHSVAIPGLGKGIGQVSPEICARQMYKAIEEYGLGQYTFPQTWMEAQVRHQRLYSNEVRNLQFTSDENTAS